MGVDPAFVEIPGIEKLTAILGRNLQVFKALQRSLPCVILGEGLIWVTKLLELGGFVTCKPETSYCKRG
jgi:hypothetical protein